jgi:nitrogen regulatory protein PII
MKLIIITAVKEFEINIKQILKRGKVHSYSYNNVNGFKNSSEDGLENNWFATQMQENESVLFYAFVQEEKVDSIFEYIAEFNKEQETLSYIHISVLDIEKSN